jgi:integrator complex subunit 7
MYLFMIDSYYINLYVRYSHHSVAAGILSQLREQVSSEHFHFWLVSLEELSRGEAELLDCSKQPSLVQRLSQAVAHYSKAVAALKVKGYRVLHHTVVN